MLADTSALLSPPSGFLPNLIEVSASEDLTRVLLSSALSLEVRSLEHLTVCELSDKLMTLLIEWRASHSVPNLKSLTISATSMPLAGIAHLGACFPNLIKLELQLPSSEYFISLVCPVTPLIAACLICSLQDSFKDGDFLCQFPCLKYLIGIGVKITNDDELANEVWPYIETVAPALRQVSTTKRKDGIRTFCRDTNGVWQDKATTRKTSAMNMFDIHRPGRQIMSRWDDGLDYC